MARAKPGIWWRDMSAETATSIRRTRSAGSVVVAGCARAACAPSARTSKAGRLDRGRTGPLMARPADRSEHLLAAALQRVAQRRDDLALVPLRQHEDLAQGDADVGDELVDVGALLDLVGHAASMADVARETPTDLHQGQAQLTHD